MSAPRDVMVRELVQASASLQRAHAQAVNLGDSDLAHAIRETAFSVGIHISSAQRPAAAREERTS